MSEHFPGVQMSEGYDAVAWAIAQGAPVADALRAQDTFREAFIEAEADVFVDWYMVPLLGYDPRTNPPGATTEPAPGMTTVTIADTRPVAEASPAVVEVESLDAVDPLPLVTDFADPAPLAPAPRRGHPQGTPMTRAAVMPLDVRQASRVVILQELRRGLLAFVHALDLAIDIEKASAGLPEQREGRDDNGASMPVG
jgi:hypothetical protein